MIRTMIIFIFTVYMLSIVMVFAHNAYAGGRHDDHKAPTPITIIVKEDDDSGKYAIAGVAVTAAIWCVVEKCWKKDPEPYQKFDGKITPDNLSDNKGGINLDIQQ